MTFKNIILLLGLPGPPRLKTGDSKAKGPINKFQQNYSKTGNFSTIREINNWKT